MRIRKTFQKENVIYFLASALAAAVLLTGCPAKRIDLKSPFMKQIDMHMELAYKSLSEGNYPAAAMSAKNALDEANKYNSMGATKGEAGDDIDTNEMTNLRAIALFYMGDYKSLDEIDATFKSKALSTPTIYKLGLYFSYVWTYDIKQTNVKIDETLSIINQAAPEAALYNFVAAYASLFMGDFDNAKKRAAAAAELSAKWPKLFVKEFADKLETLNQTIELGEPGLVCMALCRGQVKCPSGESDCAKKCVAEALNYNLLRKKALKTILTECRAAECGTLEKCLKTALNEVSSNFTDNEAEAMDKICRDFCEDNIKCLIIDAEIGACINGCPKALGPLNEKGLKEFKICFKEADCEKAKKCFKALWKMPVHGEFE